MCEEERGRSVAAETMTMDEAPSRSSTTRWLALLVSAAAFGLFGFIFGTHWLVLYAMVAKSPTERKACLLHFALMIVALLVTAGGGGYCRMSGTYVRCGSNVTMSRVCLFEVQPPIYRTVYIIHFVGGAWILASFVLDGIQLISWCCRQELTSLFTDAPLMPSYAAVVSCAVVGITITWTCIVDWDDGTLNRLLAVLIVLIVVVGILGHFAIRVLQSARTRKL